MISYLRVIFRDIQWKGKDIKIGGIGDVATLPEFRGKGYASILVREAVKLLDQNGADVLMLFTDPPKAKKLYGSVGFVVPRFDATYQNLKGEVKTIESKNIMIAPVGNPKKFNELMNSTETIDLGESEW